MQEVELKYNGLKLKHLEALTKVSEQMTIKNKVELISSVLNVDKTTLYRCDVNSIDSLYNAIIHDVIAMQNAKLVKSFSLNGQTYVFVEETKQPIGWVIDAENIEKTPENIMALYYMEKECKNYSEGNEDGTQKFDTYLRAEKLKEADLSIYIGLSNYLKKKWELMGKILNKITQIQIKTIQ